MMEAPFLPPNNPAFPITAYYLEGKKAGLGSRTIWVSPLKAKLTFKNDTVAGVERTAIISYQDVLKSGFRDRLEHFYKGKFTFNMDLESLHEQIVQFVKNADITDKMFRDLFQVKHNKTIG